MPKLPLLVGQSSTTRVLSKTSASLLYIGLGTSTSAEGKRYFRNIDRHRIDFSHTGEQDDQVVKCVFFGLRFRLLTWHSTKRKQMNARNGCASLFLELFLIKIVLKLTTVTLSIR